MENLRVGFEGLADRELTVNGVKIKQDQRNALKNDIEELFVEFLDQMGLNPRKVGKEIAFELDNHVTKLPKGYVPVKVAISVPSVDFDVKFEGDFYDQDQENKAKAAEEKRIATEAKKKRDAEERARMRALKQQKLEDAQG